MELLEYKCLQCGQVYNGQFFNKNFCCEKFDCKYYGKRFPYCTWKCKDCDIIFKSKHELQKHRHDFHVKFDSNGKYIIWNKGLTKETSEKVKKQAETQKENYKNGLYKINFKPLTENQRKKLSESMKKAHREGRAHNIGMCRWNNEPSYPEKWFMKVIENEFIDKNYKREYPFYNFSLDFAWIHKKKCIEIDGDQHQRFQEYIDRDKRKDCKLLEENWTCLRLIWKNVCKETKKYIQIAKDFIDS